MVRLSWLKSLLLATAATTVHALAPGQALRERHALVDSGQSTSASTHLNPLTYRSEDDDEVLKCFQVASPVLTPKGPLTGDHRVGKPPKGVTSSCQKVLMEHHFANSYGQPFVANYEPPDCSFNRVAINFTVVSEGRQFDRLAIMYLGDNEVWRTSTAEPTSAPGIIWTFWKDMTPFLSLWKQPQTLVFDLGNIVNDKYTGLFNSTLTATFFEDDFDEPSAEPADLILPVTKKLGSAGKASSFTFPEDVASTLLTLPRNANRAVFAVSANGQSSEEFWWSNVPESGADALGSEGTLPGLSGFREVRVRIDGAIAGMAWPFPVIFTGGVSPPLHRPIVGLEAFDLRENEIDITPWLGYLSDGQAHNFSMEVVGVDDTDGIEFATPPMYWVLTGKVFLWLDADDHVTTGSAPEVSISPLDYTADQDIEAGVSLTYRQTVHRHIEVKGHISTAQGPVDAAWRQQFDMTNNGAVTDQGNYQSVVANYMGQDRALSDGSAYFYTGYRYPIDMDYQYTAPDGDWDFSLGADLYQGLDRTVTGLTALSNGLAPFINKLTAESPVSGSSLSTHRNGSAFFYEYDQQTKSAGHGTMSQHYELVAAQGEGDAAAAALPLLYSRDVTAVNETIVRDKEYAYKAGCAQKGAAKHGPLRGVGGGDGAFAPLPRGKGGKLGLGRFVDEDEEA